MKSTQLDRITSQSRIHSQWSEAGRIAIIHDKSVVFRVIWSSPFIFAAINSSFCVQLWTLRRINMSYLHTWSLARIQNFLVMTSTAWSSPRNSRPQLRLNAKVAHHGMVVHPVYDVQAKTAVRMSIVYILIFTTICLVSCVCNFVIFVHSNLHNNDTHSLTMYLSENGIFMRKFQCEMSHHKFYVMRTLVGWTSETYEWTKQ